MLKVVRYHAAEHNEKRYDGENDRIEHVYEIGPHPLVHANIFTFLKKEKNKNKKVLYVQILPVIEIGS